MATTAKANATSEALGDSRSAKTFHWICHWRRHSVGLGVAIETAPTPWSPLGRLRAWVFAYLLADLMYVRIGRSITLSMSLPVVLAAAILSPGSRPSSRSLARWILAKFRGSRLLSASCSIGPRWPCQRATASLVIHLVAPGAWDWPLVVAACAAGLIASSRCECRARCFFYCSVRARELERSAD